MTTMADLARRLSAKIEAGRGIKLEPADLSMLVTSGAFEALQAAAAEELKQRCRERDVARELLATEAIAGRKVRHEGSSSAASELERAIRMTHPHRASHEEVEEARQRARRMTGLADRPTNASEDPK